MKNIDLGQTINTLANLSVLIGILLLVFELNQNREMMRAQTRNDLSNSVVNLALTDSQDLERVSILRRAMTGEELTEDEEFLIERRSNAWFRYWENVHYQFRVGLYDDIEFDRQLRAIEGVLRTQRRAVDHWCEFRDTYSPEFAAQINDLLSTYGCD